MNIPDFPTRIENVSLPSDCFQEPTVSWLLELDFTCLGAVIVCLHLVWKTYNWRCTEVAFHQQTKRDVLVY